MSKTREKLFEEWDDEQRSTRAMADLVAWRQTPDKGVAELARDHPDAFALYKIRLDEKVENDKRRGEQHLICERYEHERTNTVNRFLKSGKWRIANIATPVGCESYTETTPASPVNVEHTRTYANFWAVVERA